MEILTEKTRQELLSKARSADPTKTYKTTRYERRNHTGLYNITGSLNRIDMNSLFKANILSFKIPIRGETDNYEVEVLFEGITSDIKNELKLNHYKLEYKCIYRAIISAINRQDIYVSCTCDDFKYRIAYYATKGRYNSGRPQIQPAKITNPNDTAGTGCKHILKVLDDLNWAMDLATCINNYIIYASENMESQYRNIIFPVVYGMSYLDAERKGILDNDEDELPDEEPIEEPEEIDDTEEVEVEEPPEEQEGEEV